MKSTEQAICQLDTLMCLRSTAKSLQLSNLKYLQATYTLTRYWTIIFTSQQHPAFLYPVTEHILPVPLRVVSLVT